MGVSRVTAVWIGIAVFVVACAQMAPSRKQITPTGKNRHLRVLSQKKSNIAIMRNKDNAGFAVLDVRTPDEISRRPYQRCISI